ncbi:MAG: hypothetical protein WC107_01980 [Patescibacteria group bacterium]
MVQEIIHGGVRNVESDVIPPEALAIAAAYVDYLNFVAIRLPGKRIPLAVKRFIYETERCSVAEAARVIDYKTRTLNDWVSEGRITVDDRIGQLRINFLSRETLIWLAELRYEWISLQKFIERWKYPPIGVTKAAEDGTFGQIRKVGFSIYIRREVFEDPTVIKEYRKERMAAQSVEFATFYREEIGEPRVPPYVAWFIFDHPKGCSFDSAVQIFSLDGKRLVNWVEPKHRDRLTSNRLIAIALQIYQWVPAYIYAAKLGLSVGKFLKYAKAGCFGETIEIPSGALCISAKWLDNLSELEEAYSAAVDKVRSSTNKINKALGEDELTVTQVAQLVGGCAHNTIIGWLKKAGVPYTLKEGARVIKKPDLADFARRAAEGEWIFWASTREQLRKLYAALASESDEIIAVAEESG